MTISAIILAGGRATRMNGVDKGLILLQNKPLITHVIARLRTQVDEVLINANREIVQYQALGLPVLNDENEEFIGPLAGFLVGLHAIKSEYLLTVPCDSPLLPLDLAMRLLNGLQMAKSDVAVATCDGNTHPVFCLMKKSVLPSLHNYIESGERKVSTWQKSLHYVEVEFNDNNAFTNLNTFEDLAALEQRLAI